MAVRFQPRANSCAPFVLRLEPRGGTERKQVILYRQNEMPETQCSLFPIYSRLPKLDVAGSNPVFRSMRSITYESQFSSCTPLYSISIHER